MNFRTAAAALLVLGIAGTGRAQTQTVLPPVNTITANGVTCSFTVIDALMSVATECLATDGTILKRAAESPQVKGALLGAGPIICLYATDGQAAPTVRFSCVTDDDAGAGPKMVLDGKLAPVAKKRQWWVIWR